jgi:sulfur carrier protein ThiS
MADCVTLQGFKFGNGTVELANGEYVGPKIRAMGIDTKGVAILVNGKRIEEQDLDRYQLRNGDVVKATVKAIGGNPEDEVTEVTEENATSGTEGNEGNEAEAATEGDEAEG